MMRKMILALAMCAALTCMLAGCGNSVGKTASKVTSDAGSAISQAGEDMSKSESKMESSGYSSGSASSDRNDSGTNSYNSGTVDSGTDGFIGDDDSGISSGADYAPGVNSAEASAESRESSAGNPGSTTSAD